MTGGSVSSIIQREAFGRISGIERNIGAAGFENREERDHHFERTLQAKSDRLIAPHAEFLQTARESIGALIQLVDS